jgi:hypothetical protein
VRHRNVAVDPVPLLLATTASSARVEPRVRCREPAAYRTARIDDCRRAR